MAGLGILAAIGMSGCIYPVPVTEAATRGVEPGLVGEWMSADGKNRLEVRRYDDRNAVVVLNGLVLRAYHSEVAGLPLVTLQELESPERKYAYVTWQLADGGNRLEWRAVSRKVVPEDLGTTALVRARLEKERDNPALLEAVQVYERKR